MFYGLRKENKMTEFLQEIDKLSEGMQAFLAFSSLFVFIGLCCFFATMFGIIEKYIDQKYPKKDD